MTKCLYVGNLPHSATEDELRELFGSEDRGVLDVKVAVNRKSGRPRGFAFVTLDSEDSAAQALEAVRGSELDGHKLQVGTAHRSEHRGYEPALPPHERPWNLRLDTRRRRRRR